MTTNRRLRARVDSNQPEIVASLRSIPGITVLTDMNDILVGYQGRNYLYEIKQMDALNKEGKIKESAKKPSQKRLEKDWNGHYRIVWCIEQILVEIGVVRKR